MGWYLLFFLLSGFCSVLYELVWLRLCMAQFGVTTAAVSIVLSVFMAGLGLGSWASGALLNRFAGRIHFPALRIYAATELLIGVSGVLVPYQLRWGHSVLERLGSASSVEYYVFSGAWIALSLCPWCALMGATIPVGMLAIRETLPGDSARSFSFLYKANVAGAVLGTAIPLLLIELFGFRGTLRAGVICNVVIAILAFARSKDRSPTEIADVSQIPQRGLLASAQDRGLLLLLFMTGLTSMGMEVVWVRQFTPYLGTVVYAFASILGIYLSATYFGSRVYRSWSATRNRESPLLWTLLGISALLPLLAENPAIPFPGIFRAILGIAPFTAVLGFITPMLVDRWSAGDPAKAGSAYAINVAGCILGPLLAGFCLLPWISARWALVILALPWLLVGVKPMGLPKSQRSFSARAAQYLCLPAALLLIIAGKGYDEQYKLGTVLRDSTATVVATTGPTGKRLLVNGYGMTVLSPVTKVMAHLPLALLGRSPKEALVVCFGMGTTFRSLRSWGIPVTAVELVPSVPRVFGYFHADGPQILRAPQSYLVVDDGRRYLERTNQQFDVITIDPPPPVEAAASSLLYSEDFYSVARRKLRTGGILQQWLPGGDAQDVASVARALAESFPFVRCFGGMERGGFHFLASDVPLAAQTAKEMAHKLPLGAAADFVEWGPEPDSERQFARILHREIGIQHLVAESPTTPALRDDRPINEYYAIRRLMN